MQTVFCHSTDLSCASCNTRSLNASHEISRLMYSGVCLFLPIVVLLGSSTVNHGTVSL
jgi:hypothetical protein